MDVTVVTFDGGIEDFPLLVQTVDNLIDGGVRRLVIDLEPLPFINSAALGYLLSAQQHVQREDGRLALCRVSRGIQNVIRLANLDDFLRFFEDEDAAVSYVWEDGSQAKRPPRTERRHLRGAV